MLMLPSLQKNNKLTQEQAFVLFEKYTNYRPLNTYYFTTLRGEVCSTNTRKLFCLYQIYLKIKGYVFEYDFDEVEKERYLTKNGNPKKSVLEKYLKKSKKSS